MKLYHYTKFDTFIYDILPKMQLKFFPFSSSNDPFEFSFPSTTDFNQFVIANYNEILNEFERQHLKYKMICFCKDRRNIEGFKLPTMWAHYAEKHSGICIEINLEKLNFQGFKKGTIIKRSVHYNINKNAKRITFQSSETNGNVLVNELVLKGVLNSLKEYESSFLFYKLSDWKMENEYRIVYKIEGNEDVFLDINDAISRIYVGVRESKKMHKSVKLEILEHLIAEKNKRRKQKIEIFTMDNLMENGLPKYFSFNSKDTKFLREMNKKIEEKRKNN